MRPMYEVFPRPQESTVKFKNINPFKGTFHSLWEVLPI